jgi:hypothetical protein
MDHFFRKTYLLVAQLHFCWSSTKSISQKTALFISPLNST